MKTLIACISLIIGLIIGYYWGQYNVTIGVTCYPDACLATSTGFTHVNFKYND